MGVLLGAGLHAASDIMGWWWRCGLACRICQPATELLGSQAWGWCTAVRTVPVLPWLANPACGKHACGLAWPGLAV